MKRTYTKDLLQVMQVFDKVTRTPLKDCFETEEVSYFVVPPGLIGKAVGKGGVNVKNLTSKLRRKVRMIEFNPDIITFIRNVLYPLKVDEVILEDQVVTLRSSSRETKALIIGRGAKNLNTLKRLVGRYFADIADIKVE